eukprot:scaffold183987_cov39-Prasinocladus_malaysianus.AAC.2
MDATLKAKSAAVRLTEVNSVRLTEVNSVSIIPQQHATEAIKLLRATAMPGKQQGLAKINRPKRGSLA